MAKVSAIAVIATMIILAIVLIKYRFVYKVTISGKEVGYVTNINKFEEKMNEEIINSDKVNVAYIDIEAKPSYQLVLMDENCDTNEDEIIERIKDDALVTYKVYSVAVNGESAVFVNSIEEAEETVEEVKKQYAGKLEEIDIKVDEVYTNNIETVEEAVELEEEPETVQVKVAEAVTEQKRIQDATLNGVYFAVKPVTGNITSRYGATEDIRSHAHSGLDICAPAGTDIVAAADGKVTFAGTQGGYGNLIVITHENGVQTYYGHCSKLYAKVGDEVKAGDLIAAVGKTGFATGNHLHFEIRINGSTINPQKYIYN